MSTPLNNFIRQACGRVLSARTLDQAVARARFLGELLWKNNVGVLQLNDLEQQLLERYAPLFDLTVPTQAAPGSFLHVLTKAYDSGGHTRIVEQLIGSAALHCSAVLITESAQTHALQKLQIAALGCTVLKRSPQSQRHITALFRHFLKAETLILHIHPYDIEVVLAAAMARRVTGAKIFLYNHADHVFSYGHGLADRILEISHFGWALREQRCTTEKSTFAGIPLKLPPADSSTVAQQTHIASAGTSYKYRPSATLSFPDFVTEFAQNNKHTIVVVGPRLLTDWWWWRSAWLLGRRLQFCRTMPYQRYLNFISQACAYIDSFPMTGGTAFPEIACRSIPCFGILTGAHGYSPADQLKSADQATLLQDLRHYLNHARHNTFNSSAIVRQIREIHDVEHVAQRIRQISESSRIENNAPPWKDPGTIDPLFYEKMWRSNVWFALPIHALPDWKIAAAFVKFWLHRRLIPATSTKQ